MFKEIAVLSKQYKIAGNMNSITNAIQNEFLEKYHYNSYKDIPKDKIERLEEYISIRKQEIDDELKNQLKNPQYISWIYDIVKSGNQGIEDIQKLINEIQKFEYIRKRIDIINEKLVEKNNNKIDKKQFNIFNFKTYGDLHSFVLKYIDYLRYNIERDKIKESPVKFPLVYENSQYKVYSIGEYEEEDFKEKYGENGWDTGWCIAQGTVDFNEYLGEYDSYFLILKKNNEPVALISLDDLQFKDVHDDPIKNLNKDLIDVIDNLFSKNGLEITDIEDDYNDFQGYVLLKAFESEMSEPKLFDEMMNYESVYNYNGVTFYKSTEDTYVYYVSENSSLLMIIEKDLKDILYLNKINQRLVDAIFHIFEKRDKYLLNNFVGYNQSLLSKFDLKEYFDFFMKNNMNDGMISLLKSNKKLDNDTKKIGIDFLIEKSRYKSDLQRINGIYNQTKDNFLKKYIDEKILTNQKITDVFKKLESNHSKEDVENVIDLFLSKISPVTIDNIMASMVHYVQYMSKEYKEKILDYVYNEADRDNTLYNILMKCKDKEFNDMLINKCLDGNNQNLKRSIFLTFNKMNEEQKNKILHDLKGADYMSNNVLTLLNNGIENKWIPQLIDLIAEDDYFSVINKIKNHEINNEFFIIEFIKKSLLAGYATMAPDLLRNQKIRNHLMDFILTKEYKNKDYLLRYIALNSTISLSEEEMKKVVSHFMEHNDKENVLDDLLFGGDLKYYKNIEKEVVKYFLNKSDNAHTLRRLLSMFKNDDIISSEILDKFKKYSNKNSKEFKDAINIIIDRKLYNSEKQLEDYKKLL